MPFIAKLSSGTRQPLALIAGASWLLLLALAVVWRLGNIDAFGLTNDEGAYLMWARLVAEGYPLYIQTHTGSPPLFIELLAAIFRWWGFGIVLGRLVVLTSFVLLALLLGALAKQIGGWLGAYLALIIVAFSPPLFALSRQVMLEVPAMTLALAAVGSSMIFYRQQHQPSVQEWSVRRSEWLVLAGLCLGGSLLVKFLHPLTALPILVFVWYGSQSILDRLKGAVWFGVGLISILILVLTFYDYQAFFDQAIGFRASTRESGTLPLASNGQMLMAFVGSLWGLTLLALAGLLTNWRQPRTQAWGLWLLASVLLVLWYRPLFPHHLTLLLLPAILLAVEFVAFCRQSPALRWTNGQFRWGWLLLLVALFNLVSWYQTNQTVRAITTGGREAEAAAILAEVTRPNDFVMSDSQLLALTADRLTPPPLVDFSLVYIRSGRQSPQRLIEISEIYDVSAVASWALRMVWVPEYIEWAENSFWVKEVWDNDHILYFGPKHPADQAVPNAQFQPFESDIGLSGYRLDSRQIVAGQSLPLTLYWQAQQPVSTDYTMFVQLLDEAGVLAAQYDSQPLRGYFPTSQWPVTEIVPDRVRIDLPLDLPAGRYQLIAGHYDWQTGDRAALQNSPQDYVTLTTIMVEK